MSDDCKHWTSESTECYLSRMSFDFVRQIESIMKETGVSLDDLAAALGVPKEDAIDTLGNGDTLTLDSMARIAMALGIDLTIIAHKHDRSFGSGPLFSEVFRMCWEHCGRPSDLYEVQDFSGVRRIK